MKKTLEVLNEMERQVESAVSMSEEMPWKGIDDMARSKMKRRLELAKLPFERKMEILLQLQKLAKKVRKISVGKIQKRSQ